MRPASEAFLATIAGSYELVAVVEVRSPGGEAVLASTADGRLAIAEGSVVAELGAVVTAECRLSLVAPGDADDLSTFVPVAYHDLLAPESSNEIWVSVGARLSDGSVETHARGVYVIDSTEAVEDDGGLSITVVGSDRMMRIVDDTFTEPYSVAAGTYATAAISELIARTYPNLDVVSAPNGFRCSSLSWEAGTSPGDAIAEIAEAASLVVTFDGEGQPRVISPGDATEDAAWSFADDGTGSAMVSLTKVRSRRDVHNVVKVRSEGFNGGLPFDATAYDDDTASPTWFDPRYRTASTFGAKPLIVESSAPANAGQAYSLARTRLATEKAAAERYEVVAAPAPHVELGDTVRIARSRLGIDALAVIDRLELPLTPAPMRVITRARRVPDTRGAWALYADDFARLDGAPGDSPTGGAAWVDFAGPSAAWAEAVADWRPDRWYRLDESAGPTIADAGATGADCQVVSVDDPIFGVAGATDGSTGVAANGSIDPLIEGPGFVSEKGTVIFWVRRDTAIYGAFGGTCYEVTGSHDVTVNASGDVTARLHGGFPYDSLTALGACPDGVWTMITVTWDKTSDQRRFELYVDATPAGSITPDAVPLIDPFTPLLYLANDATGTDTLRGGLDEFVWLDQRVLTATQVAELHASAAHDPSMEIYSAKMRNIDTVTWPDESHAWLFAPAVRDAQMTVTARFASLDSDSALFLWGRLRPSQPGSTPYGLVTHIHADGSFQFNAADENGVEMIVTGGVGVFPLVASTDYVCVLTIEGERASFSFAGNTVFSGVSVGSKTWLRTGAGMQGWGFGCGRDSVGTPPVVDFDDFELRGI